jgi:ABC-2 type transport system permease protein
LSVISGQTAHGFGYYVLKLLRLRLLITFNGFRRAKLRRKILTSILILLILAFVVFVFGSSLFLLKFLRSPELAISIGDITPFLAKVPAIIASAAFVGILITSFGVLLQALYLAGDMDFLLATPVPIHAVFITKLLQAILPNFGLICLFSLPLLFGLGASGNYNFLYYPFVVIVLAALSLSAASLSALLVMLIVRLFPARRVAEIIGFATATLSIICSQSGQFARYSNLSRIQTNGGLTTLTNLTPPWSPLAWAGQGLIGIGTGNWLVGAGYLVLSLGLAGLVFVGTLNIAEHLYYSGWARVQVSSRKKRPIRTVNSSGSTSRLTIFTRGMIPPAIRAIVYKDSLVLRRDLRNLSQLVTPLILGVIYAVSLVRAGGSAPASQSNTPSFILQTLRSGLSYGDLFISLFIGWTLLYRLAGMGFSHEGKSYWILKSAPVSSVQLIISKFVVAYIPSLIMGWLFIVIIGLVRSTSTSIIIFNLLVVAFCIAGVDGINLTFGIAGANFDWDDPRHILNGLNGCFGAIASIAFLLIGLALFLGPTLGLPLLGVPELVGQITGLVLGGVFSLICSILPLRYIFSRVATLAE